MLFTGVILDGSLKSSTSSLFSRLETKGGKKGHHRQDLSGSALAKKHNCPNERYFSRAIDAAGPGVCILDQDNVVPSLLPKTKQVAVPRQLDLQNEITVAQRGYYPEYPGLFFRVPEVPPERSKAHSSS